MKQKEKCACNCREHLQSRNLLHVFNQSHFEHIYKKFDGTNGNAFSIGLRAADFMIENYKPTPAELEHYKQYFDFENL